MKRDLDCLDPNSILFYRLHSNTKLSWAFYLPPFEYFTKVEFSWQPRSEKTLPTCFVQSARTSKPFSFFFHGVCKPYNEPEKSGDWTHKYHKTALLFITVLVLNILLFTLFIYFLLSEFSSVICLFWHTLTATDDTHTRPHTGQERK